MLTSAALYPDDQAVVDKIFGLGGGAMQQPRVRSAQSVFGSDLPGAAENMGAIRLKHDAGPASDQDSRALGESMGALSGLGRAAGVGEMSAVGGGGGSVGVGFGVGAGRAQLPQHSFSSGAAEQERGFASGARSGMPKLLGAGGLGAIMGEEEGDELMSSIPTGLLDEVGIIDLCMPPHSFPVTIPGACACIPSTIPRPCYNNSSV